VNGVASALRSSAWNTTPAAASAAPTSAPATTRGIRATKKICASTFSLNGMDRSKTRARLIGELPMSGATRQVTIASRPKAVVVFTSRVRIGLGIARASATA
jgi:hypothetical protein